MNAPLWRLLDSRGRLWWNRSRRRVLNGRRLLALLLSIPVGVIPLLLSLSVIGPGLTVGRRLRRVITLLTVALIRVLSGSAGLAIILRSNVRSALGVLRTVELSAGLAAANQTETARAENGLQYALSQSRSLKSAYHEQNR